MAEPSGTVVNLFGDRPTIEVSTQQRPLKTKGGGGTSPPVADDPIKSRVDFLHTAFLWLAGALLVAIGTVIGISVNLSNATNSRLDTATKVISDNNREIGQVGVKVDDSNRRLDRIETKIDQLSERLPRK